MHRPFIVRPVVMLSLVALSAVGIAAQQSKLIRFGNSSITAQVQTTKDHFTVESIEARATHETIKPGESFILVLSNGKEIRSSAMLLEAKPALSPLPADKTAPRAAARIAGQQLCADLQDEAKLTSVHWCMVSRGQEPYLRQEITIHAGAQALPLADVQLLRLQSASAHIVGTVPGSPVVAGNFYLGFEHPLSYSNALHEEISAGLKRTLPLGAGQAITYSSVIGVAHRGQMRRDFLAYVEMERAHPYRTFLHYNSWYDLGRGERFGADGVLNRMHAFGENLVRKRSVVMDSFLMDDGWDNTQSLWGFDSGFPDGFAPLRATAKQYGFGLGVWLSPWGGYATEKKERIAYGKSQGYEIVKGGYALSGPRYYAKFEEACLNFITKFGVNQFKFDGTGNAGQVFPGSLFDSDFSAAIHLIERLRQQDNKVFLNVTTGTLPSPFWLRFADSIWRSGDDHSFAGEGSWRQKWITYRDEQTYRNIVKLGPLFPINSLMLHGIIYASKAEHLDDDPTHDFPAEVHSYFGSGTQLQELYVTPSLLSSADWDLLAESARWSRKNANILKDTHWIGGDPGNGQLYGWAAWGPQGGVLTLRNPSSHAQTISIDVQDAFELPSSAAQRYLAHSPWTADASKPAIILAAHKPHTFDLQPFEVLTLQAVPAHP